MCRMKNQLLLMLKKRQSSKEGCNQYSRKDKKTVRTCCSCGKKMLKDQLNRFVWLDDTVQIDPDQRLEGRGAYCCRNELCVERFLKQKKKWRRLFRL